MRRARTGAALATAMTMAVPVWLAQPAEAAQPRASIVQIVAHEDDDVLFMNPDLANGIKAGVPITTVYLTAGENNSAARAGAGLTDVGYAKARQDGAKAAYAQMAGVSCPDNSCWSGGDLPVGQNVVEHYRLNGADVHLYFLDLPDGGEDSYQGGGALRRIWTGSSQSVDTLTMSDNGSWPQHYSRSGLLDVLTALIGTSGATLVRVQDPAPDPLLLGELPDLPEHDNPDHVSAALFGDEAVRRYATPQTPRVVLDHYRDYNIQDTPANLSGAATAEKVTTFEGAYAPDDVLLPWGTGTPPTTCDPATRYYQCWESREQFRTPRSTQSVTSDPNGRLHAFAVESGSLYEWAEDADKVWQGPFAHGNQGGPLTAAVTVGRDQDGRLEVFGQRADTGEIVSNYQSTAPGGWSWGSLGSPNPGPGDALQVSAPTVASNGDGRLQVFVRNRGGGISSTWQTSPNGGWSGWLADLGGSGIQEAPAAFTTRDGRIELFAWAPTTSTASVLHWFQPAPNQSFQRDGDFPFVAPTSAPTVAMDLDGRLELLYRQLDGQEPLTQTANSSTMTLWQTSTGGGWTRAAGALGGGPDQGGIGAPAAVTAGDGRIVAAVRNRGGGVSVTRQASPNSAFGGWTDLGGPGVGIIAGVPAASVDRNGLTDLVVIGLDGRLYDNRQRTDGSFAGWKAMGTS
ncbi:PIG-L family deacetylase [Kitasatospora sp. NPDC127111]|uniref:PIG-L family deacetylase n=1 Tax=Kitasatospora sp. NPDC127111 TaxID=3345363 RepID=UPI003645A97E